MHALQQGFGEQVPHCHGACGETCVREALPTAQLLQQGTSNSTGRAVGAAEHSRQAGARAGAESRTGQWLDTAAAQAGPWNMVARLELGLQANNMVAGPGYIGQSTGSLEA